MIKGRNGLIFFLLSFHFGPVLHPWRLFFNSFVFGILFQALLRHLKSSVICSNMQTTLLLPWLCIKTGLKRSQHKSFQLHSFPTSVEKLFLYPSLPYKTCSTFDGFSFAGLFPPTLQLQMVTRENLSTIIVICAINPAFIFPGDLISSGRQTREKNLTFLYILPFSYTTFMKAWLFDE